MKNTLLSIGHGFSAQALARRLLEIGWRVIGTTRSAEKADALRAQGVGALIWPGEPLPLHEATHLLVSVAPTGSGDQVLELAGNRISASQHLKWVGYLSTTAVYGDHKGGWVDETTPLAPTTERGMARARAESAWAALGPATAHLPACRNLRTWPRTPGKGPARHCTEDRQEGAGLQPDPCRRHRGSARGIDRAAQSRSDLQCM